LAPTRFAPRDRLSVGLGLVIVFMLVYCKAWRERGGGAIFNLVILLA
jgi:hypothetical protein